LLASIWDSCGAERLGGSGSGGASLSEKGGAADREALLIWMDRRLADGDSGDAREVWRTLCRRGLLPYDADAAVTNSASRHGHWRRGSTGGRLGRRGYDVVGAAGCGWRLLATTGAVYVIWQYIDAGYRLVAGTWAMAGLDFGRTRLLLVYRRPADGCGERFGGCGGSCVGEIAVILVVLLFFGVLTMWVEERWAWSAFQCGVFVLAGCGFGGS